MSVGPSPSRVAIEPAGWAALAGLVVLHVAFAVLLFDPQPLVGGDNAHYMILAESISSGQGYRDIHVPGAPVHAQYPPLYPLVLAAAGALGVGFLGFKVLSAIFTTSAVVAIFLLARDRLGWPGGFAVTVPLAVSPVLLSFSHWVLSEALFVPCVLIALWAAERSRGFDRWLAVSATAGVLAFFTRFAGLSLLAALVLALAGRRRWRDLAVLGGAALIAVGGWWLWGTLAHGPDEAAYAKFVMLTDAYQPELGTIGAADLLPRVGRNVWNYALDVLPRALTDGAPGGWAVPAVAAAVSILVLAAVGWISRVRQMRATEWFAAFYTAMICAYPDPFATTRYLLPLLPVLVLLAISGAEVLLARLPGPVGAWALPALGVALACFALPGDVAAVGRNRHCTDLYARGEPLPCHSRPWQAFVEMAGWVKENTPEDAIVVTRKPRLFYFLSHRRGDGYPFTTDPAEMLQFFDEIGADYVVIAGLSETSFRYLTPVIADYPERFPPVAQVGKSDNPIGYVLRYISPDQTANPSD